MAMQSTYHGPDGMDADLLGNLGNLGNLGISFPTYDYLFKLLVIGDSNAGKSSLLVRFCDDSFSDSFISTIGVDFKVKTIEMNNKLIKLQIWDSAGQERFRTLTSAYYRGTHGIVIVYDITESKSFEHIDDWLEEVHCKASPGVTTMIVGNKCDSPDREVHYCRAKKVADLKGLPLLEASAKDNINVDKIFHNIVNMIWRTGICETNENLRKCESTIVLKEGKEIKKKNACC